MRKSEFSFMDAFTKGPILTNNNNAFMSFDWDKAASIIKEKKVNQPDLIAEAGLQRDWAHTSGIIFEEGEPTNDHYTYLRSSWAIPTLILSWNGEDQEEIECYTTHPDTRFNQYSKWDEESIKILNS